MKPETTRKNPHISQILSSIQRKWSWVCFVSMIALLCGCGKQEGTGVQQKSANPNRDLATAILNSQTNEAKQLLARGANPNILFSDIALTDAEHPHMIDMFRDHTALTAAVWGDDPTMVSLLLEKGADPTKRNGEGKTAVEIAEKKSPGSLGLLQKAIEAKRR